MSSLLGSPAAAMLAVEALGIHSNREQWVCWAGPLAAQALLASLPMPAADSWLKAPALSTFSNPQMSMSLDAFLSCE